MSIGTALSLILREHIAIDAMVRKCIDDGVPCFPHPDAFTRFAVYAFIALFEVIALFMYSLRVERKRRDRGYDQDDQFERDQFNRNERNDRFDRRDRYGRY